MKILLTYSSKTGNTKAVAEAILKALPQGTDFFEVGKVADPNIYDAVIVGFWIDQGHPNDEALEFIQKIKNKKTGYFFTLGAYPDSEHAKDCHKSAEELLHKNGNEVLAGFGCQGKIDPELTEKFMSFPKDHPHYMDEARRKRHQDAASHPDQTDFENAQNAFKNFG
jgi:flavodoxin family protein